MTNLEKFAELGISEATLKTLVKKGFEEPSPIQTKVIPLLLKENINIIGQAQTGTGKTAAFGIPLAEKITEHSKYPQALILTPTRELAIQVAEEISSFLSNRKINVATIYGGQSYTIQLRNLRKGADIVVGTPGRVIDHINKGTLILDHLKYMILDEADEMLNMGFIDDIKKVLSFTNEDKSILLFSATMPRAIITVAKKYMGNYQTVTVEREQRTTTQTDQIYFEVHERDKFEALCRIVDVEPDFFGIIFCRTKIDVDRISAHLLQRGYPSAALHGDVQQRQREIILRKFKKKELTVLVATDVAARGIDVNDVTHVINYSLPNDPESYIHRVGRTGRAGKKGTAITFVTPNEYRKIVFFKRVTKTDIKLAQIPDAKSIIAAKKNKIKTDLGTIIENNSYEKLLPFTQDLLTDWTPEQLAAALLTLGYQNELCEDRYSSISQVNIDKTGKSRLFLAIGRAKGYTPSKLVEYVSKTADIDAKNIQEVRIMDDFSFITVPFEDAESVLHGFDKIRKSGERSLVSKAKEKGRSSGGNRGRSSGGRNYRNSRGGSSKSGFGRGGSRPSGGSRDSRGGSKRPQKKYYK